MLAILPFLLLLQTGQRVPPGDARVDGITTIRTPTCTLTAPGYTRDEGTPGHLRHRFVVYGTGCGLLGDSTDGKTLVGYASSGELQADQVGAFLVTATPTDPAARALFAARRSLGSTDALRTLMVFPLYDRVEVIVEDVP